MLVEVGDGPPGERERLGHQPQLRQHLGVFDVVLAERDLFLLQQLGRVVEGAQALGQPSDLREHEAPVVLDERQQRRADLVGDPLGLVQQAQALGVALVHHRDEGRVVGRAPPVVRRGVWMREHTPVGPGGVVEAAEVVQQHGAHEVEIGWGGAVGQLLGAGEVALGRIGRARLHRDGGSGDQRLDPPTRQPVARGHAHGFVEQRARGGEAQPGAL